MKKAYLLGLGLAFGISHAAFAQSSVTLYGVIDTGVELITHGSPTGGFLARMPTISAGEYPSRWGLTGSEDLGGGLSAIFKVENGFTPGTGGLLLGGRLFGRQALVGLKDKRWGRLTFGRQNNMTLLGMAEADVNGPDSMGAGSFDNYLANARADNTIEYLGKFSGLTVGLTYSFGRDTSAVGNCGGEIAGDQMACRQITAMLKYDSARWGTAAIYDEQRGGPGATAMTVVPGLTGVAFTRSSDTDRRYQVNGYFLLGDVKVGGGWIHRRVQGDVQSVTTDLTYLGMRVPVNFWDFSTQISHIDNHEFPASGTLINARVAYNLSKRTAVYLLAGYVFNGKHSVYSVSGSSLAPAMPAPGIGQLGAVVGMRHLF